MECPEKDVRTRHDAHSKSDERLGHDERSKNDEPPFNPLKWANLHVLHELHEAPAAVDRDFMRAVSQSMQEIYPPGDLDEDEYFRLPRVSDVMHDLKSAVELSFQTKDKPYSGPLTPRREVIHALRFRSPNGSIPDVVRYSLMMLRQEHLLKIPFAMKRPRNDSSTEDSSRVASTPAAKKLRYDEDQGHKMATTGTINAEKPATSSKVPTTPRSLARDSSVSTDVPSKERDSRRSVTRQCSVASTKSRTRRRGGRGKSGRQREADRAYPDRVFSDRR